MTSTAQTLRVLHVLPWVASGGVERRRLQLIRGLASERFEQHVLCKEAHEPLASQMRAAGATLHIVEGRWTLNDVEALERSRALVAAIQPDIIHGAVFEGVVFAAVLGQIGHVQHIVIEETGATPARSWRGDLLMSLASALSHRTVAISPYVARYLTSRSRVSAHKLRTITNGVAFPRPLLADERAAHRAALGLLDDVVLFGCVGRVFNEHKRFSDAIDALALIEDPRARLLIVGGGPDLAALRERAAQRGCASRVIFAGSQGDVAPWMGSMDVFVITSSYEGFGLVIPEAMGVGLPVIGTRVDAIPDIVQEGVTGMLVSARAPDELADAMRWMLNHPADRAVMGAAGRARASALFGERRYVEDVRDLYEQLDAGRGVI